MFSKDPRLQQQFSQQTNQFQISPRQNQFVQSPRQFQQSPRYNNNAQMISPQQRQQIGSPKSQQLKQLQFQQSPIVPTTLKPQNTQNQEKIRQINSPQQIALTQSPKTAKPQTQVQEFRHVERPLQVITADEIEAPWKLKCAALERQILELQIQIRKNNGAITEEKVEELLDDTKIKNLQSQKQELDKKISENQNQIKQQRQQLDELKQEYEVIITEKITYASNEVETWMKKYSNLEKNYNESQQKILNLKRQLAQVEAADKTMQDQKKMEQKQEVRKNSKLS